VAGAPRVVAAAVAGVLAVVVEAVVAASAENPAGSLF
jgi:hypothetical protein